MRHPRRFFRSSLLTAGTLAAGSALALPASAAADAPLYAPSFAPPATTVAMNLGEQDVRVFHGLPTGKDDGVVRVDVDGEGRLRFAEFRPAAGGTTLRQAGTAFDDAGLTEKVLFTGAGHLHPTHPDATAVVAVVRRSATAWDVVVYGASGSARTVAQALPAAPTGLAVGRLTTSPTDMIAVSFATGETHLYRYAPGTDPSDDRILDLAVIPDLEGPLGSWAPSPGDTQLALGGTFGGQGVQVYNATGTSFTRTPMADTPNLAALQATGAQDVDRLGQRWATVPSSFGPSSAFGYAFGRDPESFESITSLNRAATARFGRKGAGRDTVVTIGSDATILRGPGGEDGVVMAGGREGTVVDIDGDGRDDLVTAAPDPETGYTALTVSRNLSGDVETRAKLDAEQFSPALVRNDQDEPSTTATSLTWTAPQDYAEYRCALDGEGTPVFEACDEGAFAMSNLPTGRHKLRVERRQQGMTFWAPAATMTFVVQPAKPAVDGPTPDPQALPTKYPAIEFAPQPGSQLQCRAAGPGTDWQPCANPYGRDLPTGTHEIRFRWVDGRGVPSDSFVWTVRVDTTAPSAPHVFGRPVDTFRTATSIGFTADADATAECRIDDEEDFTACAGPILPLTGLKPGPHKVEIRQTDQAGNTSVPAVVAFSVLAPPAPSFVSGPEGRTPSTTADFVLGVDDPDAAAEELECALDGADFRPCDVRVHVEGLAPGEHVLRVRRTVDPANPGVVAERRWIVVAGPTEEPTGPGSGNAPEQPVVTSKPAPAAPASPAPAPTAPKPAASADKPALKAPKAPVKTPSATVTGRALNVGCAVPGATSYRCEITVSKEGRRLGHAVRRGDGTVQVKLTREGARKVQRLGGLNVRVKVQATADGKTTTTVKTVRILPTKVLVVPTDGLFAFDSAKPSAAGVRLASTIAAQLFGAREITIVGHTDTKGTDEVNEHLGLQRARAFAALLRSEGLDGTKVVVRSAGEGAPRASNATERGQQLNRRVEVAVRY